MIQALTPADSISGPASPPAVSKPRRFRLRLPFRLRPLDYGSVLVHGSLPEEVAARASRSTPIGLTEAEVVEWVNAADADGLMDLPGVSAILAYQILKVRGRDGSFTELDQLALVPGLGASRFTRMFGRPASVEHEKLRHVLRLAATRDLTPRDFQPLAPSLLPPGLRRVFFAPGGGPEKMEKAIAKGQKSKLRIRKIAEWRLCLHLDPDASPNERLVHFLKILPTVLRAAVIDGGFLKPPRMQFTESRTPFRRLTLSGLSNASQNT